MTEIESNDTRREEMIKKHNDEFKIYRTKIRHHVPKSKDVGITRILGENT